MIVQGELSLAQQAEDRKYWHIFNIFNALSFVCVANNVLYLFALDLGAPRYIIPVMASFMYFGYLAMPIGKLLIARVGAGSAISVFWLIRNIFVVLVITTPLTIKYFGVDIGILMMLLGSLGFTLATSGGIIGINPLLGEITQESNRGKFTSSIFRNFNLFAMLGLIVISIVMKYYASQETYQVIILCGIVFGLISSRMAYSIKETSAPKNSAAVPIMHSFKPIFKNKTMIKLIFANIAIMSGAVLVNPISVAAAKTGYGVSDATALMFTFIQFGGGILIAVFSGMVSNHSGPRPIAIVAFSYWIISALMWIIAPQQFNAVYVGIIFLLNGAAGMGTPMALSHYFLNAIPAKDRIGYSMFISITAGTTAGLISFLVGGGLIKLIPTLGYDGMMLFKVYYCIIIFLLLIFIGMLISLDKLNNWKVGKLFGMIFFPSGIRTLVMLNKMEKVDISD